MSYKAAWLPFLLNDCKDRYLLLQYLHYHIPVGYAGGRATQEQLPRGVRRIKTTLYIPLIPTFSLKGEGAVRV